MFLAHRLAPTLAALTVTASLTACAGDPRQSPTPPTPPSAVAPNAAVDPPRVPEKLRASETEAVATRASAKGVQIYECQASLAWKLVGPDAELTNESGQRVGRHYVGPTWEAADGSKVVGELKEKADAPDGQGVPWLLLKAKSNDGAGAFSKVTSIQRVDTVGGKAPSGTCDATKVGTQERVPYRATYYFYATRG